MFAGVSSSSGATCPKREQRRQDRTWDSEVRPVRCSTSSFQTRSYHRIPSRYLRHFLWKVSRVLTSADSKIRVNALLQFRNQKYTLLCGCTDNFCKNTQITQNISITVTDLQFQNKVQNNVWPNAVPKRFPSANFSNTDHEL